MRRGAFDSYWVHHPIRLPRKGVFSSRRAVQIWRSRLCAYRSHEIPATMYGYVLIVGRPNVGKSSLFNALTGHKIAIVSDIENTTRDILEYDVTDEEVGASYVLADSGGLNFGTDDEILVDVAARVERASLRADLILFTVDHHLVTSVDQRIAEMLRKSGKTVVLVANKADNDLQEMAAYGAMSLGFEKFFPVSVSHRRGMQELRLEIAKALKKLGCQTKPLPRPEGLKVAIIGRPNVGKSSLLNSVLGEDRAIVKDEPGTTRDTTDVSFDYGDHKVVLIDTAGIRKSGRIDPGIEAWSVERTDRAIARCDVAACLIDGLEGVTAQDQHVIQRALEELKGVVLVVNKWDLVMTTKQTDEGRANARDNYLWALKKKFPYLSWVTPVFTVATTGQGARDVLDCALGIMQQRLKRVTTGMFNKFLEQASYQHAPSGSSVAHKPKIFYGTQADVNPPKFVLSVNDPSHFHFSYRRYLENKIREHFGFEGTPIVVEYRGRERDDFSDREKARMEERLDRNVERAGAASGRTFGTASASRRAPEGAKKKVHKKKKSGHKDPRQRGFSKRTGGKKKVPGPRPAKGKKGAKKGSKK